MLLPMLTRSYRRIEENSLVTSKHDNYFIKYLINKIFQNARKIMTKKVFKTKSALYDNRKSSSFCSAIYTAIKDKQKVRCLVIEAFKKHSGRDLFFSDKM